MKVESDDVRRCRTLKMSMVDGLLQHLRSSIASINSDNNFAERISRSKRGS